ncbi:Wzz/FepE/Etk N-terminal domain-containing protein [Roseivirga misakiensis]|uniref:Polysaccharide chain length determinant N-terminal domain-containing protein n=1 Tax=Roseivirga misakiensis TaxID=1563681 RepID=A0A1E5T5Y4_9BACT|nr:Wzz/FepE/Etk N-terminal domain-containing protein [Roseivirga misakiensis]OEK06785.1 hypothetical protein BFP71_03750 [Roseivirga misakiensis]
MANQTESKDNGILFKDVFTLIWSGRMLIIKVLSVFLVLGVVFALTNPNEWKAKSVILPEAQSQSLFSGSLGGLAGLTGVSLPDGQSPGDVPTQIYPNIATNTPFLLELMENEYFFKRLGEKVTLAAYITEHSKSSLLGKAANLPSQIIKLIAGENDSPTLVEEEKEEVKIYTLNSKQYTALKELRKRISVGVDKKNKIVTVSFQMQDPVVASMVTQDVIDFLAEYLTDYKTAKDQRRLVFIGGQVAEKKEELLKAQAALASFKDQNQGIITNQARSELDNLETEFDLVFNVYSNLQQQYEDARIEVNAKTPPFAIIEPVVIPNSKSSLRKSVVMILFGFLGFIGSVGFILLKNYGPFS